MYILSLMSFGNRDIFMKGFSLFHVKHDEVMSIGITKKANQGILIGQ